MSDLPYELHADTINDAATRSWNGFPLQTVVAHAIAKEIELGRLISVPCVIAPVPPEPALPEAVTAQTEPTPAGGQVVLGITKETEKTIQDEVVWKAQHQNSFEPPKPDDDRRRRRR